MLIRSVEFNRRRPWLPVDEEFCYGAAQNHQGFNMSDSEKMARWRFGAAVLLFASLAGCINAAQYRLMQGETMGTYYRINTPRRRLADPVSLRCINYWANLTKVCRPTLLIQS